MSSIQKNVAGQTVEVFAFGLKNHANASEPITGDSANITANIRIDGGSANAITDTNPTELEDGMYSFDLTQAETNGDKLVVSPESSTADVQVIGQPAVVYTSPPNITALVISGTGVADANAVQLAGVPQSLTDLKDFADAGYDPTTNKVQGVVLVDTVTANSDLVTAAAVYAEFISGSNEDAFKADVSGVVTQTSFDTKVPDVLNTTVSGNIGIDWANIENPTTAVDLSGTDIQLVATATTVTNNVSANMVEWAGQDLTTGANMIEVDTGATRFTTKAVEQAGGSGTTPAAVWSYATRILTAATNITSDASAIDVTSGVVDTVTTATNMRGTNDAALATTLATVLADTDALLDGLDGHIHLSDLGYLGDYKVNGGTIKGQFTSTGKSGLAITLGGTPVIKAYTDLDLALGNTETLNLNTSGTGNHEFEIDLSLIAFYIAGRSFSIILTGATIDGVTVGNQIIARFTVEGVYATMDANIVSALGTSITETNPEDFAKSFSFFYDVNPVTTKTVNNVGVAGASLTQQDVRDAMNDLAPTEAESTVDSIDYKIENLATNDSCGTGSQAQEFLIEDDDDDPIADCKVWITTDEAGSNKVAGWQNTDDFGNITFFLNPGDYYLWRDKTGTNFLSNPNPVSFEVLATTTTTT